MEASCPEIEVFQILTQDRNTSMTEQAISPLRRRMIEDMAIRKLGAKTQHDYVQRVKTALSVAYGAGLRVSEVAALKVSDIDSKRMLIRVEQGKGRKDRNATLSPVLLELLREWWKVCRSRGWLFPLQSGSFRSLVGSGRNSLAAP
jgi:integrase